MAGIPTVIRAHKDAGVLELQWEGEPAHRIPFAFLRGECPCASCIDEFTGRLILDRSNIPATIVPTAMGFVGNYAVKITWSDGHSTGLYTWDHLSNVVGYFNAGQPSTGRQT